MKCEEHEPAYNQCVGVFLFFFSSVKISVGGLGGIIKESAETSEVKSKPRVMFVS